MPSPTANVSGSCRPPREPPETSSVTEAMGPPRKGARGYPGLSFPEPSQDTEGLGLIFLLKTMDATVTALTANTSKAWCPPPGPTSVGGPRDRGEAQGGPSSPLPASLQSGCQQKAAAWHSSGEPPAATSRKSTAAMWEGQGEPEAQSSTPPH